MGGEEIRHLSLCGSRPPHHLRGPAGRQSRLRHVLLLLRVSHVPGAGARRVVALLHLQRVQQAFQREAGSEVEAPRVWFEGGVRRPGVRAAIGHGKSDRRAQGPGTGKRCPAADLWSCLRIADGTSRSRIKHQAEESADQSRRFLALTKLAVFASCHINFK